MKRVLYHVLIASLAVPAVLSGCGLPTSPASVVTQANNGPQTNVVSLGTNNTAGNQVDNPVTPSTVSTNTIGNTPEPPSGNTPQPPAANASSDADNVLYTGPIQHIFFHPLIAYPARAFDGDSMTQGYNDWFVTVSEFDKMLPALYKDNFILIDVRDMYDTKQTGGKTVVVKKQLRLPKGKKPLIISIDDMNYYPYMLKNGNVNKLVVDSDGSIAAESTDMQGHTVISHDNEIVPILDTFVKEHPDFSYHGEKGMINLTGYAGVLGYRTNDVHAPNYENEKTAAVNVIQHLKADGWTFASHGWGHLDDANISDARFEEDTDRWIREVEPLVGPTPVYVYPFGSRVATNSVKWKYLIQRGFHVLCGVGPTTYIQWTPDALMMDRRHIDGISLHNERKDLLDLFDSSQIIDPDRPQKY